MPRTFDLGAVLMVAARSLGISCPTARLSDLSALVNYMTSRPQVPYDPMVIQTCGAAIVQQHPWIRELAIPSFREDTGEATMQAWLDHLNLQYGPVLIEPLPAPLERSVADAMLDAGVNPAKLVQVDPQSEASVAETMRVLRGEKN